MGLLAGLPGGLLFVSRLCLCFVLSVFCVFINVFNFGLLYVVDFFALILGLLISNVCDGLTLYSLVFTCVSD